ncbi:MAG: hypothetical protein LUH21_17465 [Clostridiales bacterium]|nr:hypothetical protein [Clostridiales bacterium]
MNEFEKILEEMKKRKIIPRIHYELMAIRVLRTAVAVLIGVGIVWVISR